MVWGGGCSGDWRGARLAGGEGGGERKRQTDRQTDRDGDRLRETQRDRDTDTQTQKETETTERDKRQVDVRKAVWTGGGGGRSCVMTFNAQSTVKVL